MKEISSIDWDYYDGDLIRRVGPTLNGRPLITPGSQIAGGVIYGGEPDSAVHPEEALVVDPDDPNGDPDAYTWYYEKVIDALARSRRVNPRRGDNLAWVLGQVTTEVFPNGERHVKLLRAQIAREYGYSQFQDGMEINASRFIRAGASWCTHEAAINAWAAAELAQAGRVAIGDVSFDSNKVRYVDGTREAHAWPDWRNLYDGTKHISDAADEYYGSLYTAFLRRRGPNQTWPYWRPEDVCEFMSTRNLVAA
ncbi:MAG TPA: hypothetical protein VLE99_02160 [Candidatus Saccharimonadales bacterium]|nr:hypothetical protein [Candidatus Saccharimonadales bacterium]